MRVAHVISNIEAGGAENALCTLVEETRAAGIHHTIVSMLPGCLRARLEQAGADVVVLEARRGAAGGLAVPALARALRASRPQLVHAWMYHANVAASIAALSGYVRRPVLWGIRQSADDVSLERRLTRFVIKSGALLSAQPRAIVYNSEQGAESHERLGYAPSKRVVIPNGIDCRRFRPSPVARERLRAELGLRSDAVLIGRVGRYAAMKDYPTLIRAFSSFQEAHPGAHLVLVGRGITPHNEELARLCRDCGCAGGVHLLGSRLDMPMLYPAFDLLVSASRANEGFPNSVAEALACGTPVVSTSVGHSMLVQDGCHLVVPPQEPEALAAGMASLLRLSPAVRRELSVRGRSFILNTFDAASFAAKSLKLYRATLQGPPA